MSVISLAHPFDINAQLSSAISTQSRPTSSRLGVTNQISDRRHLSWTSASLPSLSFPKPHDQSTLQHQSTTPATSDAVPVGQDFAIEGASSASSTSAAVSEPPLTSVTDILDPSTIHNVGDVYNTLIPEQIGYLKQLGLDFGWGPTSMIQYSLEHVHMYTGLPWWGSIILTAVGMRIVLIYAAIQSSDVAARMGALKPVTNPISDRMMAAYKTQDTTEVQKAQQEMREIMKQANIKYSRMILPLLGQGVLAFCALKLLRNMAALPVPGLQTGGALWFTDLTVADPTYLLPLTMAGSLHMLVRYGGETGAQMDSSPGMKSILLYVMPVVVFVSMSWFPAAVVLWLATTGAAGIAQARLLQNRGVREYLNLAPLITKPQDTVKTEAKPTETVIDVASVKGAKSADPTKGRYQAPNIRRAQSSAHVPATKATAQPVTPSVTAASASGIMAKPRDWLTAKANEVGDGFESTTNWVKSAVAERMDKDRNITQSRTMNRRQQEAAARYEAEFQKRKGQK